ncbi:putative methyltransferase KIAA1456 [Aphelenchoides besseyi]|nr:putative methyltransferase KIAA1456 [Aphelenchoides besseyi]
MNGDVEQCYVHEVYTKLAAHAPQSFFDNASQRNWPNVSKFLQSLQIGSVIVDVGCGPNKYATSTSYTIGLDNCSEVLVKAKNTNNANGDIVIGDALNLPFRKDIADAVLCVSVLHHFSTSKRRKRVLQQISDVLAPRASVIIYVWAKEQPYGEFESQDVLVPWNMHEIPLLKDHFPYIRFHRHTTREQRIIANSIPIEVDNGQSNRFIGSLVKFVSNKLLRIEKQLPPAIPHPMLSRRLKSLQTDVTELYATELTHTLIEEGMAEALSTLRRVIYYRYYHVFRRGELEELIAATPGLKLVNTLYDSANCFKKWSARLREMKMEEEIQKQRMEQVVRLRDKLGRERILREQADMLTDDDIEQLIDYLNAGNSLMPQNAVATSGVGPANVAAVTTTQPVNQMGVSSIPETIFNYNRKYTEMLKARAAAAVRNPREIDADKLKLYDFEYNRRYGNLV